MQQYTGYYLFNTGCNVNSQAINTAIPCELKIPGIAVDRANLI